MARNIAWKVSGHDGDTVMHDTKQDIDYMYAQGWPNVGANIFNADLYGNVGFPSKWPSYSQLIEQSKKSSLLNFVTNGYRTTPNVGVYSGTSKTSGHYSFYREEVVANGTNSQITHRDPVAINTQAPQIVDYNVAANHTYRYTAYPTDMNDTVFATTAINPNATGSDPFLIQTPMINWSIAELLPVGPTTDIPSVKKEYQVNKSGVWIFRFNVSTGENTQNVGRDQVTNLSQYNKMAQGKRNYMSGTVSCYLGSELVRCTGEYNEEPRFTPLTTSNKSIAMLKAWRRFVSSKNPKLLKDRKGNKYIVQLTSMSDRVDDNVPCQPSFVNFSWQEIESCDNVLITGQDMNDTIDTAQGQAVMQTIKLPTPIIHGAAFIGDTIWNTELDTPAFEDSYHFIFSIENDPLTDYYEWSLIDITSPTNSTGYEKQTVRKENIAPIIIPNGDGSGSLDHTGAFQEGHKYMLRVRGRADNSAIEPSNYYSQVIECKWLWGPNKWQELYQGEYSTTIGNLPITNLLKTNWGFSGMAIKSNTEFKNNGSIGGCVPLGSAINCNRVSLSSNNSSRIFTVGDEIVFNIDASVDMNSVRFVPGERVFFSRVSKTKTTASLAELLYRDREWSTYNGGSSSIGPSYPVVMLEVQSIDKVAKTISVKVLRTLWSTQVACANGMLWSYGGVSTPDYTTTSDYDKIYPWSEIKRSCGTWENGYYKRIAYEGEGKFSNLGNKGDVFVEFPLFYYADFSTTSSSNLQFSLYESSSTKIYPTEVMMIAQYPYHYGGNDTQPDNICNKSFLHQYPDSPLSFAVGFISAYEINVQSTQISSRVGENANTYIKPADVISAIKKMGNPAIVAYKYTDHYMLTLLMQIEYTTTRLQDVFSAYLLDNRTTNIASYLANDTHITLTSANISDSTNSMGYDHQYKSGSPIAFGKSGITIPNKPTTTIAALVPHISDVDAYVITMPNDTTYTYITPLAWPTGATEMTPGTSVSMRNPYVDASHMYLEQFFPCRYRGVENPFGNVRKVCSDIAVYSNIYYYTPSANIDASNATTLLNTAVNTNITAATQYLNNGVATWNPYIEIPNYGYACNNTIIPLLTLTTNSHGNTPLGSRGSVSSSVGPHSVAIGGPYQGGTYTTVGVDNIRIAASESYNTTRFSIHRTHY